MKETDIHSDASIDFEGDIFAIIGTTSVDSVVGINTITLGQGSWRVCGEVFECGPEGCLIEVSVGGSMKARKTT